VNFCGNLVNQFPLNTTLRVDFTPGTPCSTVGAIVVISG
jgi:hypothetical protein